MKQEVEKRKASGIVDYFALALTTCGVGYIPGAPGTYGSMVAVAIYLAAVVGVATVSNVWFPASEIPFVYVIWLKVFLLSALLAFSLLGIWASTRATELFGDSDPSSIVVDEVIGQWITLAFVPFGDTGVEFIVVGFLLFRLFDIWKPYPIDSLQHLPGGLGVCADDILAGVYAGISLNFVIGLYHLIGVADI